MLRRAGAALASARARAPRYGPALTVAALWLAAAALVRPAGDVLVNDDFSYVRALEALLVEGRIAPTGWGAGGPSLIAQLLWGSAFVSIFGWSLATLQLSVVAAALLGLLALVALLQDLGVSRWQACAGALVLAANPLFFSQSLSFMTDVPFTSALLVALLALQRGFSRRSWTLLVLGLLLSLVAILVRQTGLVLPVAVAVVAWRHPQARELGRLRVTIVTLLLNVLPWLLWERFLAVSGSTPVTSHWSARYLAREIAGKGWFGAGGYAISELLVCLLYTAFFVSPLLLRQQRRPSRRHLALLAPAAAVLFAAALVAGLLRLPVAFHRNVIVDFGIGPLLFKDTYLLGLRRIAGLPPALYGLCLSWAVVSAALLLRRASGGLGRIWRGEGPAVAHLAWFCTAACVLLFPLTGFHDRYLIPVFATAVVALAGEAQLGEARERAWWPALAGGAALLLAFAAFSVAATHDFLATRRAAHDAHLELTGARRCPPCEIDAGFELNGWWCYQPGFQPRPGLSWWWVERERALLTLGPLQGYRTHETFPVRRWLGRDGAVHVLEPLQGGGCPGDATSAGRRRSGSGP